MTGSISTRNDVLEHSIISRLGTCGGLCWSSEGEACFAGTCPWKDTPVRCRGSTGRAVFLSQVWWVSGVVEEEEYSVTSPSCPQGGTLPSPKGEPCRVHHCSVPKKQSHSACTEARVYSNTQQKAGTRVLTIWA